MLLLSKVGFLLLGEMISSTIRSLGLWWKCRGVFGCIFRIMMFWFWKKCAWCAIKELCISVWGC